MLGTLFHFTKKEHQLHKRVIALCKALFKNKIIPADLEIINHTEGPGKKIHQVLKDLSIKLNKFIFTPHEKTKNAIELFKKNKNTQIPAEDFIEGYVDLNVQSATLCSYLLDALYEDQIIQENSLMLGYFLLFSSFLYLNAAIASNNCGVHNAFFEAHAQWINILEYTHYSRISNVDFHVLHRLYSKRYHQFFSNFIRVSNTSHMCNDELDYHIRRQNKRSLQYGANYKGEIIRNKNCPFFFMPDPETIVMFINRLDKMIQQNETRLQIVYYYNSEFGPVEVFDIHFYKQEERFEIIHINPAKKQLFPLLPFITEGLHSNGSTYNYKILTCDAELQTDLKSSALYAFLLSRLLPKTSFAELQLKAKATHLKNVQTFSITAVGMRAIKMAQSFTRMKSLLKVVLPSEQEAEEAKNKIIAIYALKDHADINEKVCYVDIMRQRLNNRYKGIKSSYTQVKEKLHTTDNGIALRRAAAGTSSIDDFEVLVEEFEKLNLEDKDHPFNTLGTKQPFRALEWTFKQAHPKRAALLLKAGANPSNAKKIYDECPENGTIRINPVIRSFFK